MSASACAKKLICCEETQGRLNALGAVLDLAVNDPQVMGNEEAEKHIHEALELLSRASNRIERATDTVSLAISVSENA